jgi:hypothetical protein
MAATWPLAQQRFLPGDQVTLPLNEIRRLRVSGFLVDPNANRADRGARWAAVALKQPLIRELPRGAA